MPLVHPAANLWANWLSGLPLLWGGSHTAVITFSVLGSFESILGAACSISSSMLLPALFFYRWAKGCTVIIFAWADA